MATTNGRARNRHRIRPGMPGPVAEHRPKIVAAAVSVVVVIAFLLVGTSEGRDVAASMQRFLLYYAGVFALLTLTGSVLAGLVATDRIFLTPGRRVLAQAVHRAVSFGALSFLLIHIVTEILAQRVHIIDGAVPFLSPFRRFYIGLGTLAADIMVLLVATSIVRKRFTAHGQAWRWRAVHYAAYLCYATGLVHGLMAGRSAKPYVYWSYGVAVALVVFGIAVRIFTRSLRPTENMTGPPAKRAAESHAAPLHAAAALSLAHAQLGATTRLLPAGAGMAGGLASSGSGFGTSGAFLPLGAPPFGDAASPYSRQPLASLPAPAPYEPGYLGPPRYQGAQRGGTGPLPQVGTGPLPRLGTGPFPRAGTGPQPRLGTGPFPRAGTGPQPRLGTGPMPRAGTGPQPGPGPLPGTGTGPQPRLHSGPGPRADHGRPAQPGTRPFRRADSGAPPGTPPGPDRRFQSPGPFRRGDDQ